LVPRLLNDGDDTMGPEAMRAVVIEELEALARMFRAVRDEEACPMPELSATARLLLRGRLVEGTAALAAFHRASDVGLPPDWSAARKEAIWIAAQLGTMQRHVWHKRLTAILEP
jgi:hypothetical protein